MRPMKSEPPTPTRVPDDQLSTNARSTKSYQKHKFIKFPGLGSGVPIPSVSMVVRSHDCHILSLSEIE